MHGGSARLTVDRQLYGRSLLVRVAGVQVARMARAGLTNPWVALALPGADPEVIVAQVQLSEFLVKTLVFVDGRNLDDGVRVEDWRARAPAALDGFELAFNNGYFGWKGAVFLGVCGSVPFLAVSSQTRNPAWLVGAMGAFLVCSGWVLAVALLIRWLKTKRSWPEALRRLIVPAAMFGLPGLLIVALQALTERH